MGLLETLVIMDWLFKTDPPKKEPQEPPPDPKKVLLEEIERNYELEAYFFHSLLNKTNLDFLKEFYEYLKFANFYVIAADTLLLLLDIDKSQITERNDNALNNKSAIDLSGITSHLIYINNKDEKIYVYPNTNIEWIESQKVIQLLHYTLHDRYLKTLDKATNKKHYVLSKQTPVQIPNIDENLPSFDFNILSIAKLTDISAEIIENSNASNN